MERGFELVKDAFVGVLRTQPGTGAAVAVWLEGRCRVDLWGGTADASGTRPWDRDSIVQPYSVTKPFVAVCALRLVERGKLELDAPVQRYWPEFTARATVRQLLAEATSVQASGIDQVFGGPNAFGLGFGIDDNGFGMGGLGGSYGGASRDQYAVAFVTGSMGSFDRATSVENALRTCLGLAPLVD